MPTAAGGWFHGDRTHAVLAADPQVLAGHEQPGRLGAADQAGRQLVAQGEGLEPHVRAVFDEGAVQPARPRVVGARDIGIGVRRRPAVEEASALVRLHDAEAAVRGARVDDLVPVGETEKQVQRHAAVTQPIAQAAVEVGIAVAEDDAIVGVDDAIPVGVLDFVLTGDAVHRGIHEGARVAGLPQPQHLVAIDAAQRLPHADDVHVAGPEEILGARRERELRHGHAIAAGIEGRAQIHDPVAVVPDVERALPGEGAACHVDGRHGHLHAGVADRPDVAQLAGKAGGGRHGD